MQPNSHAAPSTRVSSAGFSLVEVLVASAILSIGVVAVMAILPQPHQVAKDAGRLSILERMAQARLERLQSLPSTHSELAATTHPTIQSCGSGVYCYPVSGYAVDYSLRWTVTQSAPEANMKTIVVEATFGARYSSGGARIANPRSLLVDLRTFVSN